MPDLYFGLPTSWNGTSVQVPADAKLVVGTVLPYIDIDAVVADVGAAMHENWRYLDHDIGRWYKKPINGSSVFDDNKKVFYTTDGVTTSEGLNLVGSAAGDVGYDDDILINSLDGTISVKTGSDPDGLNGEWVVQVSIGSNSKFEVYAVSTADDPNWASNAIINPTAASWDISGFTEAHNGKNFLAKDQANDLENGIYTYYSTTDTLVRHINYQSGTSIQSLIKTTVYTTNGITKHGTRWISNTAALSTQVVGTDDITYKIDDFVGNGSLTNTHNTLTVNAGFIFNVIGDMTVGGNTTLGNVQVGGFSGGLANATKGFYLNDGHAALHYDLDNGNMLWWTNDCSGGTSSNFDVINIESMHKGNFVFIFENTNAVSQDWSITISETGTELCGMSALTPNPVVIPAGGIYVYSGIANGTKLAGIISSAVQNLT